MKIAVSAQGQDKTAQVDPRFGRCQWFVVIDTDNDEVQAVANGQAVSQAQGAGIQAAKTVMEADVEVVLTGHCGPNAFRALNAAGIQVASGASGTVAEAVSAFQNGALQTAQGPDVQSHW